MLNYHLFLIFPRPWYTRPLFKAVHTLHKHTNTFLTEILRILIKREMTTRLQSSQVNILYFFTVQTHTSKQNYCIGMLSLCDLITVPYILTCNFALMLMFLVPVHSKYTFEWTLLENDSGERRSISGSGIFPGTTASGPFPFLHFSTYRFQTALWVPQCTSQVLQVWRS